MTNEGLSLVDIAEIVLRETKEPMSIYDLFDKVVERKGLEKEVAEQLITGFYSDLTVSAKFVYVGDNTWDVKDNQKIELWEKDGSYFKEYNEVIIPEDFVKEEKPEQKAPVEEVVAEPIVEAAAPVEEVVAEPTVEPVVEPVSTDQKEDLTEFASEEFDDELFDDFDEDKYNEYMDTYEDQYDD